LTQWFQKRRKTVQTCSSSIIT